MERICETSGKICYSRKKAGEVVNLYHRRRYRLESGRKGRKGDCIPQRVYFCEDCKTYHVTHLKYYRDNYYKEDE